MKFEKMDKVKDIGYNLWLCVRIFYWKWSKILINKFFGFMDEMDSNSGMLYTIWGFLFNAGILGVLLFGIGMGLFGVTWVIGKLSLGIKWCSLILIKGGLGLILVGLLAVMVYWLVWFVNTKLVKNRNAGEGMGKGSDFSGEWGGGK